MNTNLRPAVVNAYAREIASLHSPAALRHTSAASMVDVYLLFEQHRLTPQEIDALPMAVFVLLTSRVGVVPSV